MIEKFFDKTYKCDVSQSTLTRAANHDSLKNLCRAIALLRGHYKSCEISDIKITDAKNDKNDVYTDYQVRKFAERILEFAKRNGNGYATSLHDLEEHVYFLLGGRK